MTQPQSSWNSLSAHPFSLKKIGLAHPMIFPPHPPPHINNDRSLNKHRLHFQFSLLPARSCTQVVCNSHIPSCFWRVSEALRHWGLPVTFFFELLFRRSLLSLFYVTREFNTDDELDIACVCGTLQFYNLQVVAWFWSFMFWFSSSADYLRLDHTGRQYTDVIKLYHIFIILYSPLILV